MESVSRPYSVTPEQFRAAVEQFRLDRAEALTRLAARVAERQSASSSSSAPAAAPPAPDPTGQRGTQLDVYG